MNPASPERPTDRHLTHGTAALAWAVNSGAARRIGEHSLELARRNRQRRWRRVVAGGASAAVLVCAVLWLRLPTAKEISLPPSVVVTAPPTRVLPDGTVVELRADAAIAPQFTDVERRVELQRGTAHFKVAPNPKSPFVVVANGVAARALGTAFSVEIRDTGVNVIVTEGRVQVGPRVVEPGVPATILSAGQGVSVKSIPVAADDSSEPPLPMSRETIDEMLAWRAPKIEFSGTPLAEALDVFNRYSSVKLELSDRSLATVQLSGILKPDSPDAILRILNNDFDIVAEPETGGRIHLRRR